jgi:hypothetical protein
VQRHVKPADRWTRACCRSGFVLDLEDLTSAILACFQIDVMGAAALPALLILDMRRTGQRIMSTALAGLHA